jgi:hypothetical protein
MKQAILIIDLELPSNCLINGFLKNDIGIILIQTSLKDFSKFKYNADNVHQVISTGILGKDIYKIENLGYEIIIGLYGNKKSIKYADYLFNHFLPKSANNIINSEVRFIEKFRQVALRLADLEYVRDTPPNAKGTLSLSSNREVSKVITSQYINDVFEVEVVSYKNNHEVVFAGRSNKTYEDVSFSFIDVKQKKYHKLLNYIYDILRLLDMHNGFSFF